MPSKPSKNVGGYQPTVWVSCDLDESEKKHLKANKMPGEQLVNALSQLVDDGYKVSVSKDEKNDCVGAFLTAPKVLYDNQNVVLSSRGPDVDGALRVLMYKHFEILKGDWGKKIGKGGVLDPWG